MKIPQGTQSSPYGFNPSGSSNKESTSFVKSAVSEVRSEREQQGVEQPWSRATPPIWDTKKTNGD